MEACLHFRGAALNASEAGISRATEDDGPLRTAVAKAIMLPCGDKRGIDCWSLVASGGENFDKRCRDFRLWQNRGISEILGGGRLKSPDLVSDKQTAQWAFAASSPR